MLIEDYIVRHTKAADTCCISTRCEAPDSASTLVGNIDSSLSIDCCTNGSHNTRGQQSERFAIQAHTIDLTYRAVWYYDCLCGGIESNAIDAILTSCCAWRSRQIAQHTW